MKQAARSFDIHLGMFDFRVRFLVCDRAQVRPYLRRFFRDPDYETGGVEFSAHAVCFNNPRFRTVIWMPRAPVSRYQLGVLCHECSHAAFELLRWAGIPIGPETEEVHGHAMTYLYNQSLVKFQKLRRLK